MVYCIQGELAFSSAARRDAVLVDINTQLAQRERWGGSTAVAAAVAAGPNGILLDARFTTRAALDSLRARIEAFATGQRLPIAGSFLDMHDCVHDESAPRPCAGVVRRAW